MSIRLNPDLIPNLLASIEQAQSNETTATQDLSSGQSVNQLSDNPAAAAALVLNHNQSDQDAQYLQNLNTLQGRYQTADSALSNVVQVMTSALSLAVEGANGTMSSSDLQSLATEAQGLLSQVVSLANTSYAGAYIFGGTSVNTQPFTLDTTDNTVTYNGNDNTTTVELSNGNSMTANVPGDQLFQNSAGSVIGSLQDLYTALSTGNNISGAVTEVQSGLDQLNSQRVFYGDALNQISQSESFLNQDKINLSSQENTLVGADMATEETNFSQAEVASQAIISATSEVLNQKTLLDYIV